MDNPTWHHISTKWSGMNDVLVVYVDGKQVKRTYEEEKYPLSFSGGGRLGLSSEAPVPIRWTSFNMWNRELSYDVIAEQAKSCNGAIGNVKEWYDVWSVMKTKTNYVTKPSSCSAPPVRNPLAPASDTTGDDLQSSGKSLFAKHKKRKSSIKDGSNTHH